MGFLPTQPTAAVSWADGRKWSRDIRRRGIQQFLATWRATRDSSPAVGQFIWGEEVEYMLVKLGSVPQPAIIADELIPRLNSVTNESIGTFHAEYAAFMVEGIPANPHPSSDTGTAELAALTESLSRRRQFIQAALPPGIHVVTMVAFPLLGSPVCKGSGPSIHSQSSLVSDDLISAHPRFSTLTRSIRERRGRLVDIAIPLADESAALHLDAMVFGMGCCCLQATFQAASSAHARRLYDRLIVIAPVMLALSAGLACIAGRLVAVDSRWAVISQAVDDRFPGEAIPKSRYASCSLFADPANAALNDVAAPIDEETLATLTEAGVDETLARHLAHLFIRDPLVVYPETDLSQDDSQTGAMNLFENIQSTNWQTARLKPPSLSLGINRWRVEFRPMEVQLEDSANAHLLLFLVLLVRSVLESDESGVIPMMPISLVDGNMQRAQQVDACASQRFWWVDANGRHAEMPLSAIIADLCNRAGAKERLAPETLKFITGRANGSISTDAHRIRSFLQERAQPGKEIPPRVFNEFFRDLVLSDKPVSVDSPMSTVSK